MSFEKELRLHQNTKKKKNKRKKKKKSKTTNPFQVNEMSSERVLRERERTKKCTEGS